MRLIIIRHGETHANAKHIVQGHLNSRLNKKGMAQAKKIGLRLKGEKIDVIFSSDLTRARQTASEIGRFHKAPIHYVKQIRERNAGIFEGRPFKLLLEDFARQGTTEERYKPEKGRLLLI